ncbi:MAG: cytochrome b/b6 domain-containing protein [Phycisphaerales bacterium]|jgi:cytochrome b subunit of formate dehydrogenase
MYQTISITALFITFACIAVHCIIFPSNKKRQWNPVKKLVHLFTLLFIEQKLSPVGVLRKLVYLLALLCFVVLAITGFYPTLVFGEHISGYPLMIHATFAPVFAICLAILAVMWASRCRFACSDWPWFQRIVQRVTLVKNTGEDSQCESTGLVQKIMFWLIIFLALPLILSIVVSMFPIFGTHWQELLLDIHRYTALVFAIVGIVHIYLVIRTKMKQ